MPSLRGPARPLTVDSTAPAFSLRGGPDISVSLSDFSWSPVVLLFYKADFHTLCVRQLTLFNEALPEIYRYRAHVLGISTDNIWSHMAFANEYNLHFPLLSDFHPKGRVCKAYNTYQKKDGESTRAVYVINKHGKIAWAEIAEAEVVPSVEGAIKTLENLE